MTDRILVGDSRPEPLHATPGTAAEATVGSGTPGVALTIGVFDGIHRGHQDLISRMVEYAGPEGLDTVCITFEPDPEAVLHPDRETRGLSSIREREERIHALGVGTVDIVPFTMDVARETPAEFVDWLCSRHPVRALWVGPDFALGRDRSGGIAALRDLGAQHGFQVVAIEPLQHHGRPISSSWIRDALSDGDVQLARELLGRPYGIEGAVVTGMRRGHELGFPTANILPPPGRALPADGVYLVRAAVLSSDSDFLTSVPEQWFGVANLGARPTFDESSRLLETHLLDFSGDLYGSAVRVSFLQQIRGIRRFSGIDELREQIARDVTVARGLARSFAEPDRAH